MNDEVVVLGAGYAGAKAIQHLESELDDATLTWISETDYHLVLHESHRLIRRPDAVRHLTIPVTDIKSPETTFIEGRVAAVEPEDRTIHLEDGNNVNYDYLLIALGSDTAYYGIPGLETTAHTLKSLDDAIAINQTLTNRIARGEDPVRVVIGGAGLSGVQIAGEIAELRDDIEAPIEIVLAEALPTILPRLGGGVQMVGRNRLLARDVRIMTDDPIVEVTDSRIEFDTGEPLDFDVLIWTGGVTGRAVLADIPVVDGRNRVITDTTFATEDDRIFAIGDSALIETDTDPIPPTAQAAWQAAAVAASNVAARMNGDPLATWTYENKGTLISIGHDAIAHDVVGIPVETFDSFPARFLKRFVAARWIAGLTNWPRALRAWPVL